MSGAGIQLGHSVGSSVGSFPAAMEEDKAVTAFPARQLPHNVAMRIFGNLSPVQLAQACRVSREWNALASEESLWEAFDLKEVLPFDEITGINFWEQGYGIEKPSKREIIKQLHRNFTGKWAFMNERQEKWLALPPEPVRGYTINELASLTVHPRRSTQAAPDRDGWVLIQPSVLPQRSPQSLPREVNANLLSITGDLPSPQKFQASSPAGLTDKVIQLFEAYKQANLFSSEGADRFLQVKKETT